MTLFWNVNKVVWFGFLFEITFSHRLGKRFIISMFLSIVSLAINSDKRLPERTSYVEVSPYFMEKSNFLSLLQANLLSIPYSICIPQINFTGAPSYYLWDHQIYLHAFSFLLCYLFLTFIDKKGYEILAPLRMPILAARTCDLLLA